MQSFPGGWRHHMFFFFFHVYFFTYTPRKFNSKSPRKIYSSPVKNNQFTRWNSGLPKRTWMNHLSTNPSSGGKLYETLGSVYQVCSGCVVLSFWSLPLFWCHPSASFPMLMGPSWHLGAILVGWLWGWKSGILVQGSFSQKLRISKTALNCPPPPTGNESSSNHWVICENQKVYRSCWHVIFFTRRSLKSYQTSSRERLRKARATNLLFLVPHRLPFQGPPENLKEHYFRSSNLNFEGYRHLRVGVVRQTWLKTKRSTHTQNTIPNKSSSFISQPSLSKVSVYIAYLVITSGETFHWWPPLVK